MLTRPLDHTAMGAVGYTEPWSVRAGDDIELSLSCSAALSSVKICRLDTSEIEFPAWPVDATGRPEIHRSIAPGAYLRLPGHQFAGIGSIETIAFELYLTINPGERTILDAGRLTLCLIDRTIVARLDGRERLAAAKIPLGTWLIVRLDVTGSTVRLQIRSQDVLSPLTFDQEAPAFDLSLSQTDILLGASENRFQPTLNAKFAGLKIEARAGTIRWDFPTRVPDDPTIISSGARGLSLYLVNQPTFCATSIRWDGSSFDPRQTPDQYDAVHCHDDDLGPLDWPSSYRATIPKDAAAGIYAFEVDWGGGSERIVFFVTSRTRKNSLVYVVPTATYLAYADETLPEQLYEWKCDDRGHQFARSNNFRSLYDYHSDLSGVSICSYRKPKATLRDDYRYPLSGGPHNLPVDLHFLRFCHQHSIPLDIVTDHELHGEGIEALGHCRAVVTGSHPEYISVEMDETLRQFLGRGGSLAYLGGNGFAGAVAFKGDLMELRRSPLEAGRTWDGTIAEQVFSINNEPAGHLRARGRGEFSLVGGGISLMGFSQARPFVRLDTSYAPEQAWLFDGVGDEPIGTEGIVLGGAAGYEVDSTNHAMGTSPDTIVIAKATGFPSDFSHDASRWYAGGDEERKERCCAEMTLRYLSAGGLIFSASSVAWCGALPAGATMNDVGTLTLNLLKHLSAGDRPCASAAANSS